MRGADMKRAGIGVLMVMGVLMGTQIAAQTAVIRELSGRVEVKAPGAAEWKAAEPGQVLDRASLISTGFKSMALISIGNSTITVQPLTRLSLEEIAGAQEGERVVLELREGRIRADVKPPAEGKIDFSVRSPMATASVRGTVFEFDGNRITVGDGRVHLSGESVTGAYVGPGHATTAEPERGSTAPVLEVVKEALGPALPLGVEVSPASPAPVSGGLGVIFDWPEE
jgi:hypothetical protein